MPLQAFGRQVTVNKHIEMVKLKKNSWNKLPPEDPTYIGPRKCGRDAYRAAKFPSRTTAP